MTTSRVHSALSLLLRPAASAAAPRAVPQIRCAHRQAAPIIPSPTPFVPDVSSFLTLIGRGLSQHSAKFPTWEALFSLTSAQLKEVGIEPPRTRRYLIHWRDNFRKGLFGPGGDLKHVQDGAAKLAIEEVELGPLHVKRRLVNIPFDKEVNEVPVEERVKVDGYHVKGPGLMAGPYAQPMKGGNAILLKVTEGMWEEKRGRKIDGGERRRAEVRRKKRLEESRARREASGPREAPGFQ